MLQRAGGADRLNNLELSLDLSIRGPRMNEWPVPLLSLLGLLPDGIAWQDLDALLPGQGPLPRPTSAASGWHSTTRRTRGCGCWPPSVSSCTTTSSPVKPT